MVDHVLLFCIIVIIIIISIFINLQLSRIPDIASLIITFFFFKRIENHFYFYNDITLNTSRSICTCII